MQCHLWRELLKYIPNTLPSGLSPKGLCEVGTVLEDEQIYEEYEKRFSLKFQDWYAYQVWLMLVVTVCWSLSMSRKEYLAKEFNGIPYGAKFL